MVKSLALYFVNATWAEIATVLKPFAQPIEGLLWTQRRWYFPSPSDYSVMAYKCDTIFQNYEDDEVAWISRRLGGAPSATLQLELSSSKGDSACDDASSLTTHLLTSFEGLAGTLYGPVPQSLWTLKEITGGAQKDGQRFLDCYRTRSSERDP